MTTESCKKNLLAIDGGEKTIPEELTKAIPWPPVFPETAERMKALYLSGQWSFNGYHEQRLVKEFAAFHGSKHSVFMVNGTVTLETALHALGVKPGDEVIVPALTWLATAMSAVYNYATPVFVDVEPDTYCLDPEKVKQAITPKTKVIIPVHIYGSMANMDEIMKIAKEHKLSVIEDCAHAHGGFWDGKGLGSIGDIGSFSFQQSKTMSSGEGGICTTNSDELCKKLYRIKHIGYDLNDVQGAYSKGPEEGLLCHNYRGVEFVALVLRDSLKVLKEQTETREKNVAYLRKEIDAMPGLKMQARGKKATVQGYYTACFRIDISKLKAGKTYDGFIKALNAEGLPCGPTYGLVHKHLLWSVPADKYRIHSLDTADAVCKSAVCMQHKNLLGGHELMEKFVEAIKKVSAAFLN